MERDLELRERAERVRWWATSIPDPRDRERLEGVARDYEETAEAAGRDRHTAHNQSYPVVG